MIARPWLHLLPLILAGATAGRVAATNTAPRLEEISHRQGRFVFDHRPVALVVVDKKLMSFDQTKELFLALHPPDHFLKITICEPEKLSELKSIHGMEIFSFGGTVAAVAARIVRATAELGTVETPEGRAHTVTMPWAWFILLPPSSPPASVGFRHIGVVLRPAPGADPVNRAWRGWADYYARPVAETASAAAEPLARTLDSVSSRLFTQIEEEEQRWHAATR